MHGPLDVKFCRPEFDLSVYCAKVTLHSGMNMVTIKTVTRYSFLFENKNTSLLYTAHATHRAQAPRLTKGNNVSQFVNS